jgi:DNA-binding transcriptional regulator YdaS (Cro superfamily)
VKILSIKDYPESKHSLIRAILQFGGNISAFSKLIGVSHQGVRGWLTCKRPSPSPKWCSVIESISGGEISRSDLRPDIFGITKKPTQSTEEKLQKCIGILSEISSELSTKVNKRGK